MRPDDPTPPRGIPLPRPHAPPPAPPRVAYYVPVAMPPPAQRRRRRRRDPLVTALIVLMLLGIGGVLLLFRAVERPAADRYTRAVAGQRSPGTLVPESPEIQRRIVEGWSSVPEIVSVDMVSTRGSIYGEVIAISGQNRRETAIHLRLIAERITEGSLPFQSVIIADGITASDWQWDDRAKEMRETRLTEYAPAQ